MNTELTKKYRYWEWRTILVLMVGYALYYFVRKNFSIAIPAIEHEIGRASCRERVLQGV